ncbi:MAG TPA: glycerate kinase [Verrucomicrobiae bacterium]|nr:glycerate kinase [Verrucomicrobiae bacterium]
MKIVIAFDKFKGSLSAPEACGIVRDALRTVRPDLEIVVKPMADGGDGTATALHSVLDGAWISLRVTGPVHGGNVDARYLWIDRERLAVVEMAQASGLVLVRPGRRNPLETTTYGTGELIRDAIGRGARKILLGVGGSATVDGGVGAATALGWQFLDARRTPIGFGGGELERIARILPPPVSRSPLPVLEVLCDVDNPFCGERGAARVFGPQKGATPEMVERLEAGLRHLVELVKTQLGKDIADVPGAGAAGGLAAGALAFMDARLVPGVDAIAEAIDLDGALNGADWVITGEGCFDEQSLCGKVVSGVVQRARQLGVRTAVLAGSLSLTEGMWREQGIEIALATRRQGISLESAIADAAPLLAERARELAIQL